MRRKQLIDFVRFQHATASFPKGMKVMVSRIMRGTVVSHSPSGEIRVATMFGNKDYVAGDLKRWNG